MKDILLSMVESNATQVIKMQSVANHVTAIRETLVFWFPQLEDDLRVNINMEEQKSAESLQLFQLYVSKLKELIDALPQ